MCRPRARPMSSRTLTGEVPWSAPSTLGMGGRGVRHSTLPHAEPGAARPCRSTHGLGRAPAHPSTRPRPAAARDEGRWDKLMLTRAQRARVEARTASAVHRPIPRHDRVPRPARDEGRWGLPTPPFIASLARKSCSPTSLMLSRAQVRPCRSTHALGRAPAHPSTRPRPAAARDEGRWGSPLPPPSSPHWREIVFSHQPHADTGAARPCRSPHGVGRAPAHPSTRPRPAAARDEGRWGFATPPFIASLARKSCSPTSLMLSRAQCARVEARTPSAVRRPIPRHDRVPRPARDEGRWGSPLHPPHRLT